MRRPIADKIYYIKYLLHTCTYRGITFYLQELPVPHTVLITATFTIIRLINIVPMDAATHTPIVHAVTIPILILHCE